MQILVIVLLFYMFFIGYLFSKPNLLIGLHLINNESNSGTQFNLVTALFHALFV